MARKRKCPRETIFNWLSKGDAEFKELAVHLLDFVQEKLEEEGFFWVKHSGPDRVPVRPGIASFERLVGSELQFIDVTFHKSNRRMFWVRFGVFQATPGVSGEDTYSLVKSGKLTRKKTVVDNHAWWGAERFGIFLRARQKKDFEMVERTFVQVIDELNGAGDRPNIYVSGYTTR